MLYWLRNWIRILWDYNESFTASYNNKNSLSFIYEWDCWALKSHFNNTCVKPTIICLRFTRLVSNEILVIKYMCVSRVVHETWSKKFFFVISQRLVWCKKGWNLIIVVFIVELLGSLLNMYWSIVLMLRAAGKSWAFKHGWQAMLLDENLLLKFAVTIWAIWNRRNEQVRNNYSFSSYRTVQAGLNFSLGGLLLGLHQHI
jgi:hypothetical protein